jgi:hypothetical protein
VPAPEDDILTLDDPVGELTGEGGRFQVEEPCRQAFLEQLTGSSRLHSGDEGDLITSLSSVVADVQPAGNGRQVVVDGPGLSCSAFVSSPVDVPDKGQVSEENGGESALVLDRTTLDKSPEYKDGDGGDMVTAKRRLSNETEEAFDEVEYLLREMIQTKAVAGRVASRPAGAECGVQDSGCEVQGDVKEVPPADSQQQVSSIRGVDKRRGLMVVTEDIAIKAAPDLLGSDAIARLLRDDNDSLYANRYYSQSNDLATDAGREVMGASSATTRVGTEREPPSPTELPMIATHDTLWYLVHDSNRHSTTGALPQMRCRKLLRYC